MIGRFGKERFDIVISTELLEHVRDWRKAISNIKNVCKGGGLILITTRSPGFSYHAYPDDYWRYEADDMRSIFSDCVIEKMDPDIKDPGILVRARKPAAFIENDLSGHELYSIVAGKRVREIDERDLKKFQRKFMRAGRFEKLIQMIKVPLRKIAWFIS